MIMLASQIVALLQALLVAYELRRLARESEWLEGQVAALQRTVSRHPAAPAGWGWASPAQQSSGLARPPAPSRDLSRPSLASSLGRPGGCT